MERHAAIRSKMSVRYEMQTDENSEECVRSGVTILDLLLSPAGIDKTG
jgi:hypothetical protein